MQNPLPQNLNKAATGTTCPQGPPPPVQNYFNYFTEIEQRFQQRRGSLLMLSTLDWALIETWREAGIPLEAVLRGIDNTFDRYEERKARAPRGLQKVNGLAWCAQEVLASAEQTVDAATGTAKDKSVSTADSGFEPARIAAYLRSAAQALRNAILAAPADNVAKEIADKLDSLAAPLEADTQSSVQTIESLELHLTTLEEKFFAALLTAASEDELLALREQAARELAPYRSRISAVQSRQIEQQFLRKRLLEARSLPRLSLFYMGLA
jgi:hypothetical protein